MEACVMMQAAFAVRLNESKAVLKSNFIESYGFGIHATSSQVEIENVHFSCHQCIKFENDSEVEVKKCVFQEEPRHFNKHAMAVYLPLIGACKSTLSIEDSIIGTDSSESSCIWISNSKFVLKTCQIIQKDCILCIVFGLLKDQMPLLNTILE
jgi:hypothetical protein